MAHLVIRQLLVIVTVTQLKW